MLYERFVDTGWLSGKRYDMGIAVAQISSNHSGRRCPFSPNIRFCDHGDSLTTVCRRYPLIAEQSQKSMSLSGATRNNLGRVVAGTEAVRIVRPWGSDLRLMILTELRHINGQSQPHANIAGGDDRPSKLYY